MIVIRSLRSFDNTVVALTVRILTEMFLKL